MQGPEINVQCQDNYPKIIGLQGYWCKWNIVGFVSSTLLDDLWMKHSTFSICSLRSDHSLIGWIQFILPCSEWGRLWYLSYLSGGACRGLWPIDCGLCGIMELLTEESKPHWKTKQQWSIYQSFILKSVRFFFICSLYIE